MASYLHIVAYDTQLHTPDLRDADSWFERAERGDAGLRVLETHWSNNKVAWKEGEGAYEAWERGRPHVRERWRAPLHHFLSHIMLRGEDEALCEVGPAGIWGHLCTPERIAHVFEVGDALMPYPDAWGDRHTWSEAFGEMVQDMECGVAELFRPRVAEHLWVWRPGEGVDFFWAHVLEGARLMNLARAEGPEWGLFGWYDF